MTDELLLEVSGGIAQLTLNRPEKRNALSSTLMEALWQTIDELESRQDVRVIVVRGAGPAFCAGLDLKEMRGRQDAGGNQDTAVADLLGRIEASRHPTIAMVHGDAIAGGCELALHCDLRVASERARFGMSLARIGLVVPFVLGQKLVEIAGPANTRQILLTAQPVSAQRAYDMGMVHELTSAEEIEARTMAMAETVASNAPLALAGMKAVIQRSISARKVIAHDDIDLLVSRARHSQDAKEGVAAQLERRRPQFTGL